MSEQAETQTTTTETVVETPEEIAAKAAATAAAAAAAQVEAGATAAVPEKYEFKLPDGMTMDQGALDAITPVLKEAGMSQELAQKLVEAYGGHVVKATEAQMAQLDAEVATQTAAWEKAVREDKEMGGANFDVTVSNATKAIGKFGTPELKEFLKTTGLVNHPGLVRAFSNIGKAMAEDSFVRPNGAAPGAKASIEDRMYPKSH